MTPSPLNSTVNDSQVMSCSFTKQQDSTALKIAWDGNIAVPGCVDCCMRWFITIDGLECSDPGPIDAAIRQDISDLDSEDDYFDLHRPASVVGICRGNVVNATIPAGEYEVGLEVGGCVTEEGISGSDTLTGYNSVSRFIIEEIPDQSTLCGGDGGN